MHREGSRTESATTQIVETCIGMQDYPAARQAVAAHFTLPNTRLQNVMQHEPAAALEHVQTLGRLYEQHLDRVEAAQAKARRMGEAAKVVWPPKRLRQLRTPDEQVLHKMTVDWARCTLRILRQVDQICFKVFPPFSRDEPDREQPLTRSRSYSVGPSCATLSTRVRELPQLEHPSVRRFLRRPSQHPSADNRKAIRRTRCRHLIRARMVTTRKCRR